MLRARQQIAIAYEAAAGTAETLALGDAVFHVGMAEYTPDVTVVPKEQTSSTLGGRGHAIGATAAKISWKQYLRGSFVHATGVLGTPVLDTGESDMGIPLRGCGFFAEYDAGGGSPNEFMTYTPSSSLISDEAPTASAATYCTVGMYEDGILYQIHGAHGNVNFVLETGKPVLAEFEFTGLQDAPADTALLVPIYPAFAEPPFLGASLSIIGTYTAAKISALNINMNNEIVMRPDPNDTTGYHTAQIVRRKITGTMDIEEVLQATNNHWADWLSGTLGAITTGVFPSGGTNYNQLQFAMPNCQYTSLGRTDRDGLSAVSVEFEALSDSAAGDDELVITQT